MTGFTWSSDFPTVNPYQAYRGLDGHTDVFVAKLSSVGNALLYSTYLGGSDDDKGYGIAIDAAGNAYLTGATKSTDFPTVNPYQTYQGSAGWEDVFVTKLSAAGDVLVYGTYLGGSSYEIGTGIAVDQVGCAYVVGYTASSDLPVVNPYQPSYQGGYLDAFVSKLGSGGNALVYSTYLGGDYADIGYGIAVDQAGRASVAGVTGSTNFPTVNPYQTDQAYWDVFVTRLSNAGNVVAYSTYLGGNSDEYGMGIALDRMGSAYVSGRTYSSDFPTVSPFQTNQGSVDVYVSKLALCDCPCHGDPQCDSTANVQDVVQTVNVAFRGYAPVFDPQCPRERTDVNCDGVTTLVDVVKVVNVAFRAANKATEYCNPCAPNGGSPAGTVIGFSDCKSTLRISPASVATSTEDCIEYQYDGGSILLLKHVNAAFNCCPDSLTAEFSFDGGLVTIEEAEWLTTPCKCLCLYDMDLRITGLSPGTRTITVAEPYLWEGAEPLAFTVDLIASPAGRHCVTRDRYPWGEP